MLLQKLVKRRVRRRLQQKISETKLWRRWGKQRNENLKTAKSQKRGNPGEGWIRQGIPRRRAKDKEKRRRNQSCSIPSNVHPAAILLASNDPTAGSTAATESTHADVNGTAKSGSDVCFGKTLVKRVKSVTDQFHSNWVLQQEVLD